MSCCEFTPEFKLECITEIIKLLRSGEMTRAKTLLVFKHAACFIGCGAELLIGDSDGPVDPLGPIGASSGADQLEALLPKDSNLAQGPVTAVPWLAIIQILIPILLDLLKEKR